jgi:LEA14-like dessication related protein
VQGVNGDTSTLSVNVRYYNPNKSDLKLKDARGDAYIDSIYLGHFSMDTVIKITKLSDFTIPVTLKANMKNIYRNAISLFLNKEFNIRLEGQCKVGKGGVFFPYPIRYQGKQALKLF